MRPFTGHDAFILSSFIPVWPPQVLTEAPSCSSTGILCHPQPKLPWNLVHQQPCTWVHPSPLVTLLNFLMKKFAFGLSLKLDLACRKAGQDRHSAVAEGAEVMINRLCSSYLLVYSGWRIGSQSCSSAVFLPIAIFECLNKLECSSC